MIEVRETDGGVSFLVRVQPGTSQTEICGEWQGALRIRVMARAHNGRANEALCDLLASRLKVPAGAVKIARGEQSRTKRIHILGVTASQVRALMATVSNL